MSRALRKVVRYGDRLDRVRRAGGDALHRTFIILAGCGAVGGQFSESNPVSDMLLVDDDLITETTLMVPSYHETGVAKAVALAERRNAKLPHCQAVPFVGRAEWLGEGLYAHAAERGGLIVDTVDRAATHQHLARMAKSACLPLVSTGIGGRRAAVRAWPADPDAACLRCLGLPDLLESESCTGRPLNLPDPDPTIAVIGAAAVAGALAVELATGLVSGRIREPLEVRADLTDGLTAWRSVIPRAPGCDHRPAGWLGQREVLEADCNVKLRELFALAHEKLEAEPALLLGPSSAEPNCAAERRLECVCGHVEERLWAMRRRYECPACGGTSVFGTARGPREITDDLLTADSTPASLGLPLWPILSFRVGERQVHFELRGDASAILEGGTHGY